MIGWRGTFISLSIPTMVFGMVFYLILTRWGLKGTVTEEKTKEGNGHEERSRTIGSLIPAMILAVCVQIFVYSANNFIPLYVVDHFGGSEEAAAALLSIANSAGLWAGPLAGYLSDRLGKIPIILFTGIIAGPLIYGLNHVSLGVSISVILLLLGMTQYMSMPVTEAYIISHAPKKGQSTVLGSYYFVSRGGPGLLLPAMGYLIDRYSFRTAYTFVGAGMGLISVVCTVIMALSRPGSSRAKSQDPSS
jgi:predicted MFS family arabinose efflux permease